MFYPQSRLFLPNGARLKEFNTLFLKLLTSWQYTFFVPQDIPGLIEMMGGKEKFEKKLDELIKDGQNQIVLDFTDLEYISSAGLGAVIGRIRQVRRSGGDIKVGGFSELVSEIFDTFGIAAICESYSSREQAIAQFENPE